MKLKEPPWKNHSLEPIVEEIDGIVYVEEWRPIPCAPTFEISSFGRVKALAKIVDAKLGSKAFRRERIIKSAKGKDGYIQSVIRYGGHNINKKVHQFVLAAFHGVESNRKIQTNHKDGNKENNFYLNLEAANQSKNQIHARDFGLNPQRGDTHFWSKINSNIAFDIFNTKLPINEICSIFSVSKSTAMAIKHGKSWSHITGKRYKKVRHTLTPKQRGEIERSNISPSELSKIYGVSKRHVNNIKTGKIKRIE